MNRRVNHGLSALVVLVAVAMLAAPALAWEAGATTEQPDWGTTATHVYALHGTAFLIDRSDAHYGTVGVLGEGLMRGALNGGSFCAPLVLPSGARVTAVEIEGCDDDASWYLGWGILREPRGAAIPVVHADGWTQGTPGCGVYSVNTSPAFDVDQQNNSYFLFVEVADNFDTRFKAVRVYYKLQVSPAPGTATFSDVPTDHWAFQHVEALAASGITAGCGGGDYCPDDTLTRAQMAVFLAKALGLHWAP